MNCMKNIYTLLLLCATIFFASCQDDDAVIASAVNLDKTTLSLVEGTQGTLIATITPDDVEVKDLTWMSCNESIAKVDNQGTVTAVAVGKATITVVSRSGGKSASCEVVVTAAPVAVTGITLDKTALSLNVDGKAALVPIIAPEDATNTNVKWTTSDDKVATVSATGEITALAAGTATITAATEDGNKTATCVVTVTAGPQFVISGSIIGADDSDSPYWFNDGKLVALEGAAVNPDLMTIIGNDVYIAGIDRSEARAGHIWKNGQKLDYTTGQIGCMAASGSDLYLAIKAGNSISVQKNKDEAEQWMSSDYNTMVYNIRVVDKDVYIVTSESFVNVVTVYKNKTKLYTINDADTPSMAVTATGDVYVAVKKSDGKTFVYKNGVQAFELEGGEGYDQSIDIVLDNDDVYVLRRNANNPVEMSVWKNKTKTVLNDKIGTSPMGLTVMNGAAYVYSREETSEGKYTVKQWCSKDDTVEDVCKDLTISPSAIVFK